MNALPLIVTHGWPGSIIEQLKIIDPLTNPTDRFPLRPPCRVYAPAHFGDFRFRDIDAGGGGLFCHWLPPQQALEADRRRFVRTAAAGIAAAAAIDLRRLDNEYDQDMIKTSEEINYER